MPDTNQSIEDLLGAAPPAGDESVAGKLSEKMSELGQDAKEREIAASAASLGVPYIDLRSLPLDREALPL
ncbi:MAG: hypothetical protein HY462_00795, partial [Parcubacteria group bacterium]|nr:hypothetical protein [Parcubacteria group bacterium]